MKTSQRFFVPLALLLVGSVANADGQIIDYSLSWSSAAPVSIADNSSAPDSLYRLSAVEQQFSLNAADSEFQILLPQSGISYSTQIKLAADAQRQQYTNDDPAHRDVSLVSNLYQIGYGEQLNSWFGGVNVSVEQFNGEYQREEGDLFSIGLYAGSRFALTGLDADAPLWLLSLQGEYDEAYFDDAAFNNQSHRSSWFVTPGVHWVAEGFSLTAALQVPLNSRERVDLDEPDYRLRADFEHRF